MSLSLIQRIQKEREVTLEHQGITFTFELPTLEFILANLETDLTPQDLARKQILNWAGMNESHFLSDGNPEVEVPFSSELFDIFIANDIELATLALNAFTQKCIEKQNKKNELGKPLKSSSRGKKSGN
ncbi:hypothetical protein C8R30_101166 [Nitrosomonas nitrosa]|uniref:hypothetical protein n=1 Tax=Nitrosomonas nitrosa TaxID=52442 RepID=UPI000D31E7E9|nr:hypothetical protein [Nitrosomonas nitrosa]PTR04969.1 hypothetical protein C8R30_101166 [Nitrosomonas nitrosa]